MISTKITEGAFAVIGRLAGTAAALFALLQIVVEHKRSVDAVTLQVFNNIGANQPPNSRFCRCAFYHLLAAKDREPLDRLLAREEVSLTDDVLEWTNRCFADLNNSERTDLLADKKLTKKGASVLGMIHVWRSNPLQVRKPFEAHFFFVKLSYSSRDFTRLVRKLRKVFLARDAIINAEGNVVIHT